jgi:hypothetical protein
MFCHVPIWATLDPLETSMPVEESFASHPDPTFAPAVIGRRPQGLS